MVNIMMFYLPQCNIMRVRGRKVPQISVDIDIDLCKYYHGRLRVDLNKHVLCVLPFSLVVCGESKNIYLGKLLYDKGSCKLTTFIKYSK